MLRKIAAAVAAAVVGFTATQSFASPSGVAAATSSRDVIKVTPGGRSTVYTHIPADRRAGLDRPYALVGEPSDRVVRHQEIRVGSRIVAVVPVQNAAMAGGR